MQEELFNTHFELLSNVGAMFELFLELGRCGPNAAGPEGGVLFRSGSHRHCPRGAAALANVLLQELDQFVLVLDHVAAKVLYKEGKRRQWR